jgi:hypothetical protein
MVARRGASSLPPSQEPKRPLRQKPAPDRQGMETSRHGFSGNHSNPQASQPAPNTQSNSAIAFLDYRGASYSAAAEAKFKRQQSQQNRNRGFESAIVIVVNVFLSAAAIIALTKLWPYQSVQKERLDTISAEVESAEQRVNALRAKMGETFDSGKSQEVMLRKQGLLKPNQTTIKMYEPGDIASPGGETLPSTSTAQKSNTKSAPTLRSVP